MRRFRAELDAAGLAAASLMRGSARLSVTAVDPTLVADLEAALPADMLAVTAMSAATRRAARASTRCRHPL